MTEKKAVIEYLKHFAANAAAGILHGLIGFSVALILGAFIPVQVPVNSLHSLIMFSLTVGAGAGVLGSVLAIDSENDTHFKATRVIKFVKDSFYPSERKNGSQYTVSDTFNLTISRKKSWQDYIFYI